MLHSSAPQPQAGAAHHPRVGAFVHADHGRIVGPDGVPLRLRGMGLGNWLLPEGYMWLFGDEAAAPRQIEALVADLLGHEGADRFWRTFRDRFISRQDVEQIALEGFDHVRLPINWRVLMTDDGASRPEGFALVDRLVGWCADAGLTVLLDLHGAPGGQTGTNIDDSLGRPALFEDDANADLTVALWTQIATRYRDEPTILGYDLLNEPLPGEWQHLYADRLVALYRRLTEAIRAIDPHHLLMYEGMDWATSWGIFTEVWDANSALQFHKYWSAVDVESVAPYLEAGSRLGLPVYMGEGGENTPEWIAAATRLYEANGIGWNFWPWKKLETATSPLSVVAPDGWDTVVAYAAGAGPRPQDAQRIFDDLLDNVVAGRSVRRAPVLNALFGRAPLTLPSYAASGSGIATVRRRDGSPDPDFHHPRADGPAGDAVVDLAPLAQVTFDVDLPAGRWRVVVVAAGEAVAPTVTVDGTELAVVHAVRGPAGDSTWSGELVAHRSGTAMIGLRVGASALALHSLEVEEAMR